MIKKLAAYLASLRKVTVTLLALAFANVLALIGVTSGSGIQLLLFYLLPIFLAGWFLSRQTGIFVAIWISLVWFAADSVSEGFFANTSVDYWNLLMRGGVFVIFAELIARLRADDDERSRLSARDYLTGLPNGRTFYELAAVEMNQGFESEPLTLATIEIAGLQAVNYRDGYQAGDQLLCAIAHTIQQQVPRPDLVGRMGGTTFSFLLPGTTSQAANATLRRVQHVLEAQQRKFSHPLTFFCSAVACSKPPRTVADLLQQADTQLERMKDAKNATIQIADLEDLPALN
jgi:diguanylate cyclase (GGDEF)-like protein